MLRLFLIALRSQLYVGGSPTVSIRKPLNAFLGELFLAEWRERAGDDDSADDASSSGSNSSSSSSFVSCGGATAATRLVAEQVSHHPPITAMHIADEANGVRADGYARVEMTFSMGVHIRQLGHAVLHVDRYDEDYLIPLPDVKVRGFLGGRLYPEVLGTYTIVGSSGYVSEIRFSGEGFTSGRKNAFEARVYDRRDPKKKSLYTAAGVWSDGWTVRDARSGAVLERYDVDAGANAPADMDIVPADKQDPWESRRAWGGVLEGLQKGDICRVVSEKSRVEQAQRQMRAREAEAGQFWEPLLFRSFDGDAHDVFHRLAKGTGWKLHHEKTKGVWRVDDSLIKNLQRPFRGTSTPLG